MGRGDEPHVRNTVAIATRCPACIQPRAVARTSPCCMCPVVSLGAAPGMMMGVDDRWAARRDDFPALRRLVAGKPVVYLDSAATAQKPRCVLEAMQRVYAEGIGNPHRGVHAW